MMGVVMAELAAHGDYDATSRVNFCVSCDPGASQASSTTLVGIHLLREYKIRIVIQIANASLLLTTLYAFIAISLFITFPEFLFISSFRQKFKF